MKTVWDYTALAEPYLKRPDYAPEAISRMLVASRIGRGARVCDVGAGVGHLTLALLARGLDVVAVEPNDAMRALGSARTRCSFPNSRWLEGTGEATGQPAASFDLVTFGSSFNVTDRSKALLETRRILKARGWFACLWNHRDLDDPLQAAIESLIASHIPGYGYGSRREDQTAVIEASSLFEPPLVIEGRITHAVSASDWLEAWRSHATLRRQAGDKFPEVIEAIRHHLSGRQELRVPYTTRLWMARSKD